MKIAVHHHCRDFKSYRAARVKSLFNAESGCEFRRDFELPVEDVPGWKVGVVVGPSGSGKSSLGARIFPGVPALHRPDLPQLGDGRAPNVTFITTRDDAHEFREGVA